jgi:NTP pyrophosphatase (non-canonical NTP hydrolase)
MSDEKLLLDYLRFCDSVTSNPSKNQEDFSDALDIIEEQGVAPERILTAALGICAEGGEFTEVIKKCVFQGKPMDEQAKYHLKRELGDILFYVAQACIALGISMDDVIETNIEKLEARYPGGFDAYLSNNRKEGDI